MKGENMYHDRSEEKGIVVLIADAALLLRQYQTAQTIVYGCFKLLLYNVFITSS